MVSASLVNTGTPFVSQVAEFLDSAGVEWVHDLGPEDDAALPAGPVDGGVFIVPLDRHVTPEVVTELAARFGGSPWRSRQFAVIADGDLDWVDAALDDVIDEAAALGSTLTTRRLRRFIQRHFDEVRDDAAKTFLDSTADGYWIWNVPLGEVEWSPRTYQILDRVPQTAPMSFDTYVEMVHPDDRASVMEAIGEHLEHGVSYRNVPMRLATAYGGYRTLIASGQVVRTRAGEPLLMVGAVTDRTAQLVAEQQAKEAEARYVRLFQSMNDAAVLADPMTGRIVDVNEPAERLWLRPREDLIGAPQVSLHPPDLEDDPNARETFRRHIRALQAGNRAVIQMPILRKDGSRVAVEISSSLFEVDGTQYILGLFRDITERLDVERSLRERDTQLQLASRLAAIGSLAAGIGHEINNPLSYVVGNLGFIREHLGEVLGIDGDVLSAIDDAIEGSNRVRDIVTDLKVFSRGGGSDETCEPLPVCEIAVRMAVHDVRHRASVELQLSECPRVGLSASRLSQIAVNLLTNAAQSFDGDAVHDPRVVVSLEHVRDRVVLRVEDNGSGIAPDDLDRVFDAFFTTKEAIGTGLGLSITRQLVEAVGGTITLESEIGVGTTVEVGLPVADDAADRGSGAERDSGLPCDLPTSVVVVDDDPRITASIRRILGHGTQVHTFTRASQALDRIRADPTIAEAILCDLMMPGDSGADFHDALALIDPGLAARVVFVTGGAVTPTIAAFERRMRAVGRLLEKPLDPDRLRGALRAAVPSAEPPTQG